MIVIFLCYNIFMNVENFETITENKKHGFPAILSFFIPGLGQIVKGDFRKGILFFLGIAASYLLMLVLIGFISLPILFVWNVYDAYNSN